MPENREVIVTSFSSAQIDILAARGIAPEMAALAGVASVQTEDQLPEGCPEYWTVAAGYLPALLFRYEAPVSEVVEYQLRPDVPVVSSDGSVAKYVFRKGAASVVHQARFHGAPALLLTEGTCQTIAAAAYAPVGFDVYGIAGCQSWMRAGVPSADLAVVDGRDVLIALDADAATNRNVYDAGVALREACLIQGASSVRFLRVPGGAKSGLDDVLGGQPAERRGRYLAGLIETARARPKAEKPEAPAVRMPKPKRGAAADEDGEASRYFDDAGLKVKTLAEDILEGTPAAMTAEDVVAVYRHGVFVVDRFAFEGEVAARLGEQFRTGHATNAERFAISLLLAADRRLPDRMDEPLLNVLNGMLDLRTGELLPHAPEYASRVQFPVEWNPNAKAPTYEAWLESQIPDQAADLEEAASAVLDQTTTPTKALFLFGPSKSGKSTFLRILQDIVGVANRSGVSLHQLSEDRFASANVYGMALNVSGDLSSAHVEDISLFKKMTGEDLIQANRKFGGQFAYTSRALFAFSANELPTVGESSRAYFERIKPFWFRNSFAGHERPELELEILTELPGILVRWVAAWQARRARGAALVTDPAVAERFELASDKVRRFISETCTVVEVDGNATVEKVVTAVELYAAFKTWSDSEGSKALARSRFIARTETIPGVSRVRGRADRKRGYNVILKPASEWGSEPSTPLHTRAELRPKTARIEDVEADNSSHQSEAPEGVQESTPLHTETSGTRAERADLTYLPSSGDGYMLSPQGVDAPMSGASRPELPALPALARVRKGVDSCSAIDDMFQALGDASVAVCTECGTPEALIDRTWLACPNCHPGTVRPPTV